MTTTRKYFASVAACSFTLCASVAGSHAATINAASASYSDVSAAITSASPGDTVLVPDGSATWERQLEITKGIYLTSAGTGESVITSNYTNHPHEWGDGPFLISYEPSDYSANWPLRISGFTFDFDNKSSGIYLHYSSTDLTIQTKIRIDHNIFKDALTQAITNQGMRGVVDNNTFTGTEYPIRHSSGDSEDWWNNWEGIVFGKKDNNMYIEDNTFIIDSILIDCQYGNRYAIRYNTITATEGSYPFLDMHGNQGEGLMYACFGGEVYGNDITAVEGQILDQRAGKAVVFFNSFSVTGSGWAVKVREEVWDDYNPTTNIQPQHISDSYYWNNRDGYAGSVLTSYLAENCCDADIVGECENTCDDLGDNYEINENDEFFDFDTSFDGTSGVGCGTLANRPATCTTGVGYWATDQSCSDLSGVVGVNPTTPISGMLYKCTATNTWTAYYTPYTYPHPLRGEEQEEPAEEIEVDTPDTSDVSVDMTTDTQDDQDTGDVQQEDQKESTSGCSCHLAK